MNKETFKVKPVQLDQTIKNIVDAIDKGYELQGNLLYDAIIKGYNDYVGK